MQSNCFSYIEPAIIYKQLASVNVDPAIICKQLASVYVEPVILYSNEFQVEYMIIIYLEQNLI